MPPLIDFEKCSSCGMCEDICPGDIIHMDSTMDKPSILFPDECWYCGSCRDVCPSDAIRYHFPDSMLNVPCSHF